MVGKRRRRCSALTCLRAYERALVDWGASSGMGVDRPLLQLQENSSALLVPFAFLLPSPLTWSCGGGRFYLAYLVKPDAVPFSGMVRKPLLDVMLTLLCCRVSSASWGFWGLRGRGRNTWSWSPFMAADASAPVAAMALGLVCRCDVCCCAKASLSPPGLTLAVVTDGRS